MEFRTRRGAEQATASEGAKLLGHAKEEHAAIFRKLLEKSESLSSVETYTDAIEEASWRLIAWSRRTYEASWLQLASSWAVLGCDE